MVVTLCPALPGVLYCSMRVGFTYTNNEALLKGLSNTGHTTLPGHYQQQVLAIAFEDLDWVQRYLSACRSAVRQNYNLVVGVCVALWPTCMPSA